MQIKHFTMFGQRVPDPMRPGRTALVGRLRSSGSVDPISFTNDAGEEVSVDPDRNGFYDVPHGVGQEMCRFRDKGTGFYEAGQVAEEVRLGNVDEPEPPRRSTKGRGKSAADEAGDITGPEG